MRAISIDNAPHYTWGSQCDGWHLLSEPDASVIQERMPPGTSEQAHYHRKATQFFYILQGRATFELDGNVHHLKRGEGMHVPPGAVHRIRNDDDASLEFLVFSTPHSHGDRV